MPNIILYIAQSLNGYIATSDGGVGWLNPFVTGDYGYEAFLKRVDIVVMGANTYQQVLTFGDYPYSNKTSHIYTTHILPKAPSSDIHFFSQFSPDVYRSLPKTTTVWLVGGSKMIQTFSDANLITSYQIFTMPILLGQGIPLFTSQQMKTLSTIKVKQYPNGVIETTYHPVK